MLRGPHTTIASPRVPRAVPARRLPGLFGVVWGCGGAPGAGQPCNTTSWKPLALSLCHSLHDMVKWWDAFWEIVPGLCANNIITEVELILSCLLNNLIWCCDFLTWVANQYPFVILICILHAWDRADISPLLSSCSVVCFDHSFLRFLCL